MASIHKHRDKYQVRVRRKGLPTITKTFHKLADAKEWATLQERQAPQEATELVKTSITKAINAVTNAIGVEIPIALWKNPRLGEYDFT